jgi:hypothetical protein
MNSNFVVVDGSNIATQGRHIPSLAQLDEAVREFREQYPDKEVIVVVDATFGHRIDPSERNAYEEAADHGELVSPPAGAIGRGDAFLLRVAERVGGQVLSNDSFQEFHGEHPWLFQEGRLIGGTPVPGVGWMFTPRSPVRGPKSRASRTAARAALEEAEELASGQGATPKVQTQKAQPAKVRAPKAKPPVAQPAKSPPAKAQTVKAQPAKAQTAKRKAVPAAPKAAKKAEAAKKPSGAEAAKKTAGAKKGAEAKKVAGKKTAGKKTVGTEKGAVAKKAPAKKQPRETKKVAGTETAKAARRSSKETSKRASASPLAPASASGGSSEPDLNQAIEVATEEVLVPSDRDVAAASTRSADGTRRRTATASAVNDPLTFLTFVSAHPIGSVLDGTVSSFTSHGAMIDVGDMHCYAPLADLGRPPPARARDVLRRGENRRFVLVALDVPRRGAEVALEEIANRGLQSARSPSSAVGSSSESPDTDKGGRASRRR